MLGGRCPVAAAGVGVLAPPEAAAGAAAEAPLLLTGDELWRSSS